MKRIKAAIKTTIGGTSNSWYLSSGENKKEPSKLCEVELEIYGDEKNGYFLLISPEGYFTADYNYETKGDALTDAQELFGIGEDEWSTI